MKYKKTYNKLTVSFFTFGIVTFLNSCGPENNKEGNKDKGFNEKTNSANNIESSDKISFGVQENVKNECFKKLIFDWVYKKTAGEVSINEESLLKLIGEKLDKGGIKNFEFLLNSVFEELSGDNFDKYFRGNHLNTLKGSIGEDYSELVEILDILPNFGCFEKSFLIKEQEGFEKFINRICGIVEGVVSLKKSEFLKFKDVEKEWDVFCCELDKLWKALENFSGGESKEIYDKIGNILNSVKDLEYMNGKLALCNFVQSIADNVSVVKGGEADSERYLEKMKVGSKNLSDLVRLLKNKNS